MVFIYYIFLRQKIYTKRKKIFKKHFEIISTSRKQQIWEIISYVEKTQELLMLNTK